MGGGGPPNMMPPPGMPPGPPGAPPPLNQAQALFAVVWHVTDHAEGEWFSTRASAISKFNELKGGPCAARLYFGDKVERQYGSKNKRVMPDSNWAQLDAWIRPN